MARKKDGLLELLTEVPWWVSVVLAAVVFVGVKYILPAIHFNSAILDGLSRGLPNVAWVFGLLLLVPAPISFLKSWQRQRLLDTRSDLDSIRELSWSDFELLVGEAFRRQAYSVEERGGSAPDGGVDLVLRKDGKKILVQCKHWKSRQVSVSVVRELLGVMTAQSAGGGILVTAGDYTSEARTFARDNWIRLIDGSELAGMIDDARRESNRREPALRPDRKLVAPSCPKCGSVMKKRVAKTGANVGQAFWGCTTFPKCRGTRQV